MQSLLDYALPPARKARDPLVTGQILAERSVARDESDDHAGASRDRVAASSSARQVVASEVRDQLLMSIDMAEGVAQRSASPAAAITYFGRAIDQQKRSGLSSLLPRLYYERARARSAQGDRGGEKDDLRAGLDVVAAWERSIVTPEQRAAVTVWGDAIRSDLIAAELADGDVAAAFERSDKRPEPAASTDGDFPVGDTLRNVRAALVPDAAIVEIVRLRENVITFVVRHDRAIAITLPSTASRIAAAAEALRNANDDDFASASAELYRLVFAPLKHEVAGVRTIAFVADHDLTGLSLAGLRDPERNRYLAEDFVIVHAPTAATAIRMSRQAKARTATTVVAIGASEFEVATYPDLPKLSHVAHEARGIATLWPQASVVVGAEATAETLRRELPQAAIIHFAGHIVGHGTNSRLVISGGGFTARDIARLHLSATRAVILAGCRGSASQNSPVLYGDISGAFLAAGAPVVISTTNDIDDSEAPEIMVRLHTFLRAGDDAAAALKKTIMFERSSEQHLPHAIRFLAIGGTPSLVR